MPNNREIELKATFDPAQIDRIKALPELNRRTVGSARSRKLATVYFDTPDFALRKRGLSLRVRRIGRAYMQCVKRADKRLGGMLVRTEWEGPIPSDEPAISVIDDKSLRRRLRRVGIKHLQPVFRTDIQRCSRSLRFDDGSTASLDIDVGDIVTGDASEPICEFELELRNGGPEQLLGLASEIRKTVPFRLSILSKASRGYALLTHDDPQPRKYVKLRLETDATVEQVLSKLVQDCLDHLQANEVVVLTTSDPEGVHQMRVALRRLRAALRLFRPYLPMDQYGWVVAEAKWLMAGLSVARAWDVVADEFVAPVALLYGEDQGFDALAADVEQARQLSHRQVRDVIGTERYVEFLLRLSAWLASQAWRDQSVTERTTGLFDPIGNHCVKLLQKRDRSVRRQGRNIANLSEAALHELRVAIKRLRYSVDFFEGLYPKKGVKTYRKNLAGLQDTLGYLNDVAAADVLLRDLAGSGGNQAPPAWARAGGLTVGWHSHAAIATKDRLVKEMAAFLRTEPFWRGE